MKFVVLGSIQNNQSIGILRCPPKTLYIHEVLQRAWECLGTGNSLDEIDQEINEMRQEWDRGWN